MLCPQCGQDKDVSRFIWKPNGKQARKPCRDCLNIQQRAKYQNDPEFRAKHKLRIKSWNERHPDVRREISRRAWRKNPEKAKAATRRWIEKNRDYWREHMRQWNAANRDRARELRRARVAADPEAAAEKWRARNAKRYYGLTPEQREKERERFREYAKSNRAPFNARRAKRRAAELQATPQWGQEGIKALYRLAAKNGFHVDHIIPLTSPVVCGLHVIYNLQLLPPTENLSKANRFDPDTYVHSA